jgi:methenyltetrahydrofolate cyclohydrolase
MTDVLTGTVSEYLESLAASSAVPGGGSAAALAAAMGVALVSMVAKISARKAADEKDRTLLLGLVPELDDLGGRLGRLSQDDIDAYQAVIDARKRKAAPDVLTQVSLRAAEVPLETAMAADRALELFSEVSERAWEMTRSDVEAGKALLEVGVRAALANVAVNLPDLQGEARLRIERAYADLVARRGDLSGPT